MSNCWVYLAIRSSLLRIAEAQKGEGQEGVPSEGGEEVYH
jgi:hypothetical protein